MQLRLEETQKATHVHQQRHNWEVQINEEKRALMIQLQKEKTHHEALKVEADEYKRHVMRWEQDFKTAKRELITLVGDSLMRTEEGREVRMNDTTSSELSLSSWLRAANENVAKLKRLVDMIC